MQENIFRIPVHSSSEELKEYEFKIDDAFFAHFEYGEIEKGDLMARIGAIYSSHQVKLELYLKGKVELICDRCLDTYIEELDTSYTLYGKFGHGADQDDIDVLWIPEDKHYIDLVPVLFDYINLSLPLKKIHPDDEDGNSTCNVEMINRLIDIGIGNEEEID